MKTLKDYLLKRISAYEDETIEFIKNRICSYNEIDDDKKLDPIEFEKSLKPNFEDSKYILLEEYEFMINHAFDVGFLHGLNCIKSDIEKFNNKNYGNNKR